MYNCIFSAHCTEEYCDNSCPILAETSYLLERNGITMNSDVFRDVNSTIAKRCLDVLTKSDARLRVLETSSDTLRYANLLTYFAICQNWKGSRLHCTVYNLKLSKYLEDTKNSWSSKVDPEELEYVRIWSESAKVLIVSNIDYVNFKDFESQTLLNLIQSRDAANKVTIIVSPKLDNLVAPPGNKFFSHLYNILKEGRI